MRYFPIIMGIGILLAMTICSVWLDVAGHLASGTLVLKRELVMIDDNSRSCQFLVRVVYHKRSIRPVVTDLAVNEREFDGLHIGDTVCIRYLALSVIPETRLATRNTESIIADFFPAGNVFKRAMESQNRKATAVVLQSRLIERPWFRKSFGVVE